MHKQSIEAVASYCRGQTGVDIQPEFSPLASESGCAEGTRRDSVGLVTPRVHPNFELARNGTPVQFALLVVALVLRAARLTQAAQ